MTSEVEERPRLVMADGSQWVKARLKLHRGLVFFLVLSMAIPEPPRMMSSSANYRPFLRSCVISPLRRVL